MPAALEALAPAKQRGWQVVPEKHWFCVSRLLLAWVSRNDSSGTSTAVTPAGRQNRILWRGDFPSGGEREPMGVSADLWRVAADLCLDVGDRSGGVGLVVDDDEAVAGVDDQVDEALDDTAADFSHDRDLFPVPARGGELDDRCRERGLDPRPNLRGQEWYAEFRACRRDGLIDSLWGVRSLLSSVTCAEGG